MSDKNGISKGTYFVILFLFQMQTRTKTKQWNIKLPPLFKMKLSTFSWTGLNRRLAHQEYNLEKNLQDKKDTIIIKLEYKKDEKQKFIVHAQVLVHILSLSEWSPIEYLTKCYDMLLLFFFSLFLFIISLFIRLML